MWRVVATIFGLVWLACDCSNLLCCFVSNGEAGGIDVVPFQFLFLTFSTSLSLSRSRTHFPLLAKSSQCDAFHVLIVRRDNISLSPANLCNYFCAENKCDSHWNFAPFRSCRIADGFIANSLWVSSEFLKCPLAALSLEFKIA